MKPTALAAVLGLLGPADAPVQEFVFDAEPGAWPVHGRSGHWTPPEYEIRVGLRREDNAIRVFAERGDLRDYIVLELSRHDGQLITPGVHTDQKVGVISGPHGCVDDTAEFTVDRVEYSADGWTDVFEAGVEHRCGDRHDNAFRAKVRFTR
jgi:hypothetical protein